MSASLHSVYRPTVDVVLRCCAILMVEMGFVAYKEVTLGLGQHAGRISEHELVYEHSNDHSGYVRQRCDSSVRSTSSLFTPDGEYHHTSADVTGCVGSHVCRCETPDSCSVCHSYDPGCSSWWCEEVRRVECGPDNETEHNIDDEFVPEDEPEWFTGVSVQSEDATRSLGCEEQGIELPSDDKEFLEFEEGILLR